MAWTDFNIYGKNYSLAHLNEHTVYHQVDGETVEITIKYGSHCFSDEKANGPKIFKTDNRFWSQERYDDSKMLPNIMTGKFLTGYVIPYLRNGNEQYYYLLDGFYAVFCSITRTENTTNKIKVYVVSAYDRMKISRETNSFPKGTPVRTSWVLTKKLKDC